MTHKQNKESKLRALAGSLVYELQYKHKLELLKLPPHKASERLEQLIVEDQLLFRAHMAGTISQVPPYFITKYLFQPHKASESVMAELSILEAVAQAGNLDQLPPAILNLEILARPNNSYKNTALHFAAANITPSTLKFFTRYTLSLSNQNQQTVLHQAAAHGQLNKLNTDEISEEMLLSTNSNGQTPLALALYNNHSSSIPLAIISERILTHTTQNSGHGENLVEIATYFGLRHGLARPLEWIPRQLFTPKIITTICETIINRQIGKAYKENVLNSLLGLDIDDKYKEITGDNWWKENQKILQSKNKISHSVQHSEIAMF